MSITHNKDIKSMELQATIVEHILKSCINKSSMFEIIWKIQTMLSLPSYTIKNYLFYLIDFEIILYDGQERVFTITDEGYELLDKIEKEIRKGKIDIKDISIVFECEL